MKNPGDGLVPSERGASADGVANSTAGGNSGAAGTGRHAPAGDAESAGIAPKPKRKRRRKRRRGRRVFAPDTRMNIPAGPVPGEAENAVAAGQAAPRPPSGDSVRQHRPHTRRTPPSGLRGPAYAALDLGTNNCRLLVAIPTRPGQFRVIDAFSRIVRLGEGLSQSGELGQPAMDRAVEALKVCRDKLGSRAIRRSRLIATEACRSAVNGEAFLSRVEREAGLKLEVVDRETEARLAVSGCGPLVERETEAIVLFDIGGGSSEIALVDLTKSRSPRLAEHIVSWTSLPVGVVTLAEKHGGRNVTPDGFRAMIGDVRAMLDSFDGANRLAGLASGSRFHLLGTSGTVTTIAGVHLDLPRYDRRRVDGIWLSSDQIDTTTERLLGWTYEQRAANACIGTDRADLVLAGCAILDAIRAKWPSDRLRVADRGLREGILTELMSADGAWRKRRRPRVQQQ